VGQGEGEGGAMSGLQELFQWEARNLLPILTGIVALGVVVFLHELGHFIVAKISGIGVEVFSIGFPPKILGFKRGETEYRISWIFFGGYVKLAGMDFEEGVDPRGVKNGYFASPIGRRLAVCACGPLMNLLSAFIIYSYLFCAGFPIPSNMQSTIIGSVVENSPAERAGLKPGDKVLEVNGSPVKKWEEVTKSIVYSTLPSIDLSWSRDGKVFSKTIVPERDEKLKLKRIGILPTELISVDVVEVSAAERGGIRSGDFIVSVDGEHLYSWMQLSDRIRASEGRRVLLGLMREGEPLEVAVVPRYNGELGYPSIGIKLRTSLSMDELGKNGFVVYVRRNPFTWIASNVREMYLTLKGLISRTISPRGLAGPIGIIQIMSYSMRAGLRQFLYVMAFISVNLAILNLLPIPVLDGGHILLGVVEGIRRKPLSVKAMALVQNIFLAILIALMLFIFANDIMRSWGEQIHRLIRGREEAAQAPTPVVNDKP
jgi:regulator of sigma E protease